MTQQTPGRDRKRALTGDAWQAEFDAKLGAMQRAWKASSSEERDRHLLGALVLCGSFQPLPDWAVVALRELLAARLPQQPGMHWVRWLLVREGRNKGLTWKNSYKYASERLAGTPYACGKADTIKKSYQKIERDRRREHKVGKI